MQRPREDPRRRPLLHRQAEVHDQHVVRDVPHHAEVVRDEQVGEPELGLKVGHQIQHLRLHRHVERGHRLVGDDQRGVQHQRARDRDALALPAREHVRIADVVLGAQADPGKHRLRALLAHCRREVGVDLERRLENRADLLARVERAVRILEHHLHRAAQQTLRLRRHVHRVDAVQRERARARRLEQRDDAGERRLAAAGFTDDRQRAPRFDGERHASDGLQARRLAEHAAADRVNALDVGRGDDRRVGGVRQGRDGDGAHASARSTGPSRVRSASRAGSPIG
jgi:hypothetical protein